MFDKERKGVISQEDLEAIFVSLNRDSTEGKFYTDFIPFIQK